jgi:diaminopropionate ammonia-lyase
MGRYLVNMRAGNPEIIREPGPSSLSFHSRLPRYAASPLRVSAGAAEALGCGTVWIKDESDRFGLPSFKVLGASYAVYRELKRREGFGDDAWQSLEELRTLCRSILPRGLVTATDGNHGRGVARTASWLGAEAKVFVPAGTAAARIEGIVSEGAEVEVVEGDYDAAVDAAADSSSDDMWLIQDTAWKGYERIPGWIVEGYRTIMEEMEDQMAALGARRPDLVAVQIGVGSLAAAVIGHFKRSREEVPVVIGVEPEGAACAYESIRAGTPVTVPGPHTSVMAGLNCGTLSSIAWPMIRDGADILAVVSDEEAFEAMNILAGDGIVSGESGSAGLAGAAALLRSEGAFEIFESLGLGEKPDLLLISTEGITDPTLYRRVVNPPGR